MEKAIKSHAEAVEDVNRWRNIAAHSVMSFPNGKPVLSSPAAAKLFKAIDLASKTAEKVDLRRFEDAIRKGEKAHASGVILLRNFARVAAEREHRRRAQAEL